MKEQELRLALAIQKPSDDPSKPNMGNETMALLKAGGISFNFKPRVDDAPTSIPGLDILVKKNGEITGTVASGEADLGIVGLDMYLENQDDPKATTIRNLGFSRCTLKLGVPYGSSLRNPCNLAGLVIATSYPNTTAKFFERYLNTKVIISPRLGGEEGVVKRGFAQGCVVISDSGLSFKANGLKPVCNVLKSEAILIANSNLSEKRGSERIVWRALRAIMTGIWKTQYTLLEANFINPLTDKVLAKLPAAKSPTVSSLQSGGQAVRMLIPIRTINSSLNKLYAAGASEVIELQVKSVYPNLNTQEVNLMMRMVYGDEWKIPDPPYSI